MATSPVSGSSSVSEALRSILSPGSNLSAELSTAFMSLGTAIDQLQTKQEMCIKEIEQVRRMTRTNWLMAINMPLPYGVSKSQALQQLLSKLGYSKPLFDGERDLIASDVMYVNRNGLLSNMSFFVCQRHYEHTMSAPFQRKIMEFNKTLPKGKSL